MFKEELKEGNDSEMKKIQIELLEIKEARDELMRENNILKSSLVESEWKFEDLKQTL